MAVEREQLQPRFDKAKTVTGTRSQHRFVPESTKVVRMYRMTSDAFSTRAPVSTEAALEQVQQVKVNQLHEGDFIACVVSGSLTVGRVASIAADEEDIDINSLKLSRYTLTWPIIPVNIRVPVAHLLCHVNAEESGKVGENQLKINRETANLMKLKHTEFCNLNAQVNQ